MWQPFTRGRWLDLALEQYAPQPRQFRKVWEKRAEKGASFYAWEPVPPADGYVALGMIFTTTADQPPATSCRCLHRGLVRPALPR